MSGVTVPVTKRPAEDGDMGSVESKQIKLDTAEEQVVKEEGQTD